MLRRPNKKGKWYDDYEERVANAIEDLKSSPESKISPSGLLWDSKKPSILPNCRVPTSMS